MACVTPPATPTRLLKHVGYLQCYYQCPNQNFSTARTRFSDFRYFTHPFQTPSQAAPQNSEGRPGTFANAARNHVMHASSSLLRTALARFAEWMANAMVPWAAIRGLQTSRLIALAKIPIGIRPIGIGDILTRLAAKTVLSATRSETAEA